MVTTLVPAEVSPGVLTPQMAIEQMTAVEKKVCSELKKQFEGEIEHSIMWHYELGVTMAKLLKEAREKANAAPDAVVERMSFALNQRSTTLLRGAIRVATTYSPKDLKTLLGIRGDNNFQLNYTQLLHLTAIADPVAREQMAMTCVVEKMDHERLVKRIQALTPEKPRRGGGRPPKLPATVMGCLVHMKTAAEKYINLFDNAWLGDKYNVEDAAKKLPGDKISDTMLAAVSQAREELTALQVRVQHGKQVLTNLEAEMERRLRGEDATEDVEEADEDADEDVDVPDAQQDDADEEDDEPNKPSGFKKGETMADWRKAQREASKPKKKKHKGRVGTRA